MIGRIVRDPLFAFIAIGAIVYAGYVALQAPAKPEVVLAPATRAALVDDFRALTGRDATEADIARLEADFVAEELLFREALDGGLHLTNADVRAALVEDMRFRITGVMPDPTDEELVNHYAEHLDRYRAEPTITFRHVFFRDAVPADAAERLAAGDIPAGDPFVHGSTFPAYGHSMLRGLFGQSFLEALSRQPLGAWSPALRSDHGTHFVRVSATTDAVPLPFGAVRRQVERDLRQARIDAAIGRAMQTLRQDYEIRVAR